MEKVEHGNASMGHGNEKMVKQLRDKATRGGEGPRVIWGNQRDNERL